MVRITFMLLVFLCQYTVTAQLVVQKQETVCYGVNTTLLRFSVPKGVVVERENPYISITPITQTTATTQQGTVRYGSRYPTNWRVLRDSSAIAQDNAQGRETYMLRIDGKIDAGKYRILYTMHDNKQQRYIDSTLLTVTYAGVVNNLNKRAVYGKTMSINDFALNKKILVHYLDASSLWSNTRFAFRVDSSPPLWFSHNQEQRSPIIPASAKKVFIESFWRYAETGEEIKTSSFSYNVQQDPPMLDARDIRVENVLVRKDTKTRTMSVMFDIQGVQADISETPIGSSPSDPTQALFADSTNVEWLPTVMDSLETGLRVHTDSDKKSYDLWSAQSETVRLIEVQSKGTRGVFRVECVKLPLPPKGQEYTLVGILALNASARVKNPFNGQESAVKTLLVKAPVNISYSGTNTSANKQVRDFNTRQISAKTDTSKPFTQEIIPPRTLGKLPSTQDFIVPLGDWSLARRLHQEFTASKAGGVERLYALCQGLNEQQPQLQAIIATEAPTRTDLLKPDWVAVLLAKPILTLSSTDLKALPTKVYVRDDSTGSNVAVRGSIEFTQANTLFEYASSALQNALQGTPKRLLVQVQRDSSKHIQSVVITKEISVETIGEEVLMIAADSLLVRRLSEVITPGYPRTPALDNAERDCDKATEIKRRIEAGQTVFNEMIDESSSPSDCETVKNYYQAFASLKRIQSAYILIEKKAVKQGKITVLGTLAYSTLQATPESVITAGSLSVEDLRQFKTKEYEKDDSTGSYVAVKGSMDNVPFEYCLEYCQEYVAKRLKQPFSDKDKAAIPVFIAPHKRIYRVAAMQSLKP